MIFTGIRESILERFVAASAARARELGGVLIEARVTEARASDGAILGIVLWEREYSPAYVTHLAVVRRGAGEAELYSGHYHDVRDARWAIEGMGREEQRARALEDFAARR
jgi:hypothetical protein